MPNDINVIYTPLKVHVVGYSSVADNTGTSTSVAVIASKNCKMTWNSEKIRTYSSSRLSKVIVCQLKAHMQLQLVF